MWFIMKAYQHIHFVMLFLRALLNQVVLSKHCSTTIIHSSVSKTNQLTSSNRPRAHILKYPFWQTEDSCKSDHCICQ